MLTLDFNQPASQNRVNEGSAVLALWLSIVEGKLGVTSFLVNYF